MELIVDETVRQRWDGEAILTVSVLLGCQRDKGLGPEFDKELTSLMADLRTKGKTIMEEPRVQAMRAACRAMPDMDPARYRPASEALIRRFQDSGFFRINPLVDVNNLTSARLRVPLGIYDLDRVPPTVWTYRLGFTGEKYRTLSGQEKSADGKLVLADPAGVLGSPVADSGRAPVGQGTTDIAVAAFLPFRISRSEAEAICNEIEAAFVRHFHPSATERQITPAGL